MTDGVERDWDEYGGDERGYGSMSTIWGHKNMFHINDELTVKENQPQMDPCNDSQLQHTHQSAKTQQLITDTNAVHCIGE